MKSLKTLTIIAVAALFASCSKEDDSEILLAESKIPAQIISYTAQHFPDNALTRVVKDTERDVTTYEVYLEGNFELDFNANYDITDIDGTTKLPDSVIPQALLAYVTQNYTTNYITDWELEAKHQQIELNNGIELEFAMDGTFIRVDND